MRILRAGLCLAVLALSVPARAGDALHIQGIVVAVATGDAFTVQITGGRVKLRLAGVMAPDLRQPYGTRARKQMAAMVLGREVNAWILAPDAQGHVPARVRSGTLDVNAEAVRLGIAWALPSGTGYSSTTLHALEGEARRGRRGFWAADRPEAPWTWRARMAR